MRQTVDVVRFGEFTLSHLGRELRYRGSVVAVQPRVFDVLSYLVRRSHRVVSKAEILDAVWGDVHVTEGSLQRAVSLARSALRRGHLHDALKAYPRLGYRFCAAVEGVGAVALPAEGHKQAADPTSSARAALLLAAIHLQRAIALGARDLPSDDRWRDSDAPGGSSSVC